MLPNLPGLDFFGSGFPFRPFSAVNFPAFQVFVIDDLVIKQVSMTAAECFQLFTLADEFTHIGRRGLPVRVMGADLAMVIDRKFNFNCFYLRRYWRWDWDLAR